MKKPNYPPFVKTQSDRDAYNIAVKGGWSHQVMYPYDLDAIRAGCYYDHQIALYVEKFIGLLRQSKGEWAGQPLQLQPWQKDRIIYRLFGWLRADGTRRFRKGLVFIPKKNGKSTLCAAIALYLLVADGEAGAEVYGCAANRENSRNVFDEAANMVKASPALLKRLKVYDATNGVKAIKSPSTNSYYQVLSADAASSTGKNVHGLIFDELWTQKDRKLWMDLQGGGISRRQPLMLSISTAGDDINSLCYQEYTFYKKILAGTGTDTEEGAVWSYFGYIAEADEKDDPGDPKTIAKANPGLGVSPKLEAILERYAKARHNPEELNEFKQFHLNLWVRSAKAAIPMEFWDKGGDPFDVEELVGRECYGGLDLGEVSDWAAFTLAFPDPDGGVKLVPFIWCPEDRSRDRGQKKVSYLKWLQNGLMEAMEGAATDQRLIEKRIVEICEKFRPKQVNYDKWHCGPLAVRLLNDHGLPMVQFSQGITSMAGPTRQFMELVMSGKLRHGGHEVLRWCASNLVLRKDVNGNTQPIKSAPHAKIDPLVAGIMAIASVGEGVGQGSYVEETGEVLCLGGGGIPEHQEEKPKPIPPPSGNKLVISRLALSRR